MDLRSTTINLIDKNPIPGLHISYQTRRFQNVRTRHRCTRQPQLYELGRGDVKPSFCTDRSRDHRQKPCARPANWPPVGPGAGTPITTGICGKLNLFGHKTRIVWHQLQVSDGECTSSVAYRLTHSSGKMSHGSRDAPTSFFFRVPLTHIPNISPQFG